VSFEVPSKFAPHGGVMKIRLPQHSTLRPLFLPILLTGALALSACGGNDSSSSAPAETVAAETVTDTVAAETAAEAVAPEAAATEATAATTETAATPGAGEPPSAEAQKAFRDCLEEQGVDLPDDFTFGGAAGGAGGAGGLAANLPEGVDIASLQKGLQACADKIPGGLPGPGGAGGAGANNPALTAYRTCLSDNGVTLPENFGQGGFDPADPAFVAANETCAPLLPEGFPGLGAGGAGGVAPTTAAS
jgi:hypothetical protein